MSDYNINTVYAINLEGLVQAIDDGCLIKGLVITNPRKYSCVKDLIDEMNFYWESDEERFDSVLFTISNLYRAKAIYVIHNGKAIAMQYSNNLSDCGLDRAQAYFDNLKNLGYSEYGFTLSGLFYEYILAG